MPTEVHKISLKPHDYFERSPAIDVPASTQKFNQSKLFEGGRQGTVTHESKECCSKM
jgi:hypothetical protein